MVTTQDEELGYDADHDDSRQYCEHGTFIGSWWGPDYLCGPCESGISDRAWVAVRESREARGEFEEATPIIRDQVLTMFIMEWNRKPIAPTDYDDFRALMDAEVAWCTELAKTCRVGLKEYVDSLYEGIPEEEFGA